MRRRRSLNAHSDMVERATEMTVLEDRGGDAKDGGAPIPGGWKGNNIHTKTSVHAFGSLEDTPAAAAASSKG